jgi:hypothetical protein
MTSPCLGPPAHVRVSATNGDARRELPWVCCPRWPDRQFSLPSWGCATRCCHLCWANRRILRRLLNVLGVVVPGTAAFPALLWLPISTATLSLYRPRKTLD